MILILILVLIVCIISSILYFRHTANWSSYKQAHDEYFSCLLWGWTSLFGVVISVMLLCCFIFT